MPKRRRGKSRDEHAAPSSRRGLSPRLRIVGGRFRGRLLAYHGDPRTRPMKDRTREAVFNLLGPAVKGMLAVDLFAGTGALGLEALSRGAARAFFVERHVPTLKVLRQNVDTLEVGDVAQMVSADAFHWARRPALPTATPWLVFCSPPYDFFVERESDMLALIETLLKAAPPGSLLVVESDRRFDTARLPAADWDVREYPPAVIAIAEKESPPAT